MRHWRSISSEPAFRSGPVSEGARSDIVVVGGGFTGLMAAKGLVRGVAMSGAWGRAAADLLTVRAAKGDIAVPLTPLWPPNPMMRNAMLDGIGQRRGLRSI
jgi:hypothetical protein